jgi:hypothetical protein
MPDPGATPLWKKLGISTGSRVILLEAPDDLELVIGADRVTVHRFERPCDIVVLFASETVAAYGLFHRAMGLIGPAGTIWVAWPKKASNQPSDIDGDALREMLLPTGMVDNKVCSVNSTWTALRFVVRVGNRPGWPGQV